MINRHELGLNELGVRDRLLFLTCLTYGTRISEALTLTFGDVEGEVLYINSQKGSENIGFPIPDEYKRSIDDLEEWYRDKGIKITSDLPLFLSQKGKNKSITRQLASTVIKKTAKRLNLQGRVNTHSFRKCFVSKIYEMTGYDIAKTKTYSRHKSLVNLDYYLRTTEKVDLVERLHWC
ncbi:tyrosine-type recombinase/integrase [Desulfogranum japonicum]|uniref:tyrosine-type recombinase/integrase n=1 Tax=Desulfogranum japonicum TaxID=231447 RepID=UPI001377DDE2|nr:tyrosine-type recombinase/integrase [Desulfogranum japonicum]